MKKILSLILIGLMVLSLSACSQADRVSHNISKDADRFNVTRYTVEDVSGAYVDNYHYEVNYLPEMIIPVTITAKD